MFIHEKKIEIDQKICVECKIILNVSYELKKVDGPDNWKEVSFYAPVAECSGCNDTFIPSEYAKIAYEASCVAAGVLTPDQIKTIRKNIDWGTNNTIFSSILGFGSSTIARYESGLSMPSKAHNRILTLLRHPEVRKDFESGKEFDKYLKSQKTKSISIKKLYSIDKIDQPKEKTNVIEGNFPLINSSNDSSKNSLYKKREAFELRVKRA